MRWIVLASGVIAFAFLAAGRMEGLPNAPVDGRLAVPTSYETVAPSPPQAKGVLPEQILSDVSTDVPALTEEERSYNRMVAAERRVSRQRSRVAYMQAWREWRKALNSARSSGNDEAFNRLRADEPERERYFTEE
ncbi:hypothetical protein [Sulfurimonas diazotrophicus]|uniref:DUF3106 domain-containing protein n=1 Tax=Sulfurimonas diazotrophicus TaxID=3131939 RepID=A0ABZ3HAA6_9BACT